MVADKTQYAPGDTARILVTSPFSQATGLLTIERGHLKRYQIVNIQGGAPTIDVKLEDGDLPNIYVSLTLLGPGAPPVGAPSATPTAACMPARFAQAIGATFTLSATLLWYAAGLHVEALALVAVVAVFASLEAAFGLCVGCRVFYLAMRVGLVPPSVCEDCLRLLAAR